MYMDSVSVPEILLTSAETNAQFFNNVATVRMAINELSNIIITMNSL